MRCWHSVRSRVDVSITFGQAATITRGRLPASCGKGSSRNADFEAAFQAGSGYPARVPRRSKFGTLCLSQTASSMLRPRAVTVHRMIDTARRSEVNVTVVKRNRGALLAQRSLPRRRLAHVGASGHEATRGRHPALKPGSLIDNHALAVLNVLTLPGLLAPKRIRRPMPPQGAWLQQGPYPGIRRAYART